MNSAQKNRTLHQCEIRFFLSIYTISKKAAAETAALFYENYKKIQSSSLRAR